MRIFFFVPGIIVLLVLTAYTMHSKKSKSFLFDGKTFNGWEGDTLKTWRIENGSIVGGSLDERVPHNDFLVTKK
jgi:hypothetical protein